MTVSGAYGRDYRSAKAALADWNAGKDFQMRDVFSGGSYVNKADVLNDSRVSFVSIRFNNDRGVTVWRRPAK